MLSAFVFFLLLVPAGINYVRARPRLWNNHTNSLRLLQAQFSFGLTGVNSPFFGCSTETRLTAALARKYVTDLPPSAFPLLTPLSPPLDVRCSQQLGAPFSVRQSACLLLLSLTVVIASRTCVITADAILVVITIVTLARRGVVSSLTTHSRWTLSSVLLRDGSSSASPYFLLES